MKKQSMLPTEPQLTRAERYRKRGLPLTIALGALAVGGVGVLVGQTYVNNNTQTHAAASASEASQAHTEFLKQLDKAATKHADLSAVVPDSAIVNPGNHLYTEAAAFADAHGINHQKNGEDTLLETAVAISKANYIQPNSEFVISEVDVDNNGTMEAIVQLSPTDLETK